MDRLTQYTFKFIIVGDSAVGKSCVISRFCDGKFSQALGRDRGPNSTRPPAGDAPPAEQGSACC
jgi:GTPase SAR1 family protein